MSEKNTKVRIRLGSFEFEVEGEETYVTKIIGNNIDEFIEKIIPFIVEYSVARSPAEPPKDDKVQGTIDDSEAEYPQITGAEGMTDALRKLFATSWAKTPHSLTEIQSALEMSALHYNTKDISSMLTRLIKQGEIRRIGTKRRFQYLSD